MAVDIGTGTTIVFGTSGFNAEVTDVDWGGLSREAIETTHLGTAVAGAGKVGSKTYIPGDLSDPGEISLTGHFNPNLKPPMEAAAETITVTFPLPAGGTTPATWVASGFMTAFAETTPLEDKMGFTATIKITGNITVTQST